MVSLSGGPRRQSISLSFMISGICSHFFVHSHLEAASKLAILPFCPAAANTTSITFHLLLPSLRTLSGAIQILGDQLFNISQLPVFEGSRALDADIFEWR